jgi:hypothetical protein
LADHALEKDVLNEVKADFEKASCMFHKIPDTDFIKSRTRISLNRGQRFQ